MALTGWTHETLRAQPAHVVRGLMHRVFASHAWDADVARIARSPVPNPKAMGTGSAWADAMRARVDAAAYVERVSAVLWPEDD